MERAGGNGVEGWEKNGGERNTAMKRKGSGRLCRLSRIPAGTRMLAYLRLRLLTDQIIAAR